MSENYPLREIFLQRKIVRCGNFSRTYLRWNQTKNEITQKVGVYIIRIEMGDTTAEAAMKAQIRGNFMPMNKQIP